MYTFDIAGNQIDGARDYQEDAFMITQLGDGKDALLIMADGMGGHAAGNVASSLVTSTFNKAFSGGYPFDDPSSGLNESLLKANDALRSAVSETPGLQGMGCTIVAAFVSDNKIWWVSVGDSHLYVIRERGLDKKNADHSYGGYLRLMREQGLDIDPDPKLSPNMLMSAMIGDDIAEIDLSQEPTELQPGDRIIIASDGLDTLGQGAIIQYCAWSETARDTVEALLQAVIEAEQPRQDNTTVICLDVHEGEADTQEVVTAAEPVEDDSAEATVAEEIVLEDSIPVDEDIPVVENIVPDEIIPEKEESSNKLVIVIVVVLLLIAAAAGYFLFMVDDKHEAQPVRSSPQERIPLEEQPLAEETVKPDSVKTIPETVPVNKPEVNKPSGPNVGDTIVDRLKSGGKGPEMVVLPAGKFTMGGRSSALSAEEQPRHEVSIESISISMKEISNADYSLYVKAAGLKFPSKGEIAMNHPVKNVSWDDAYKYAQWLTVQTGHKYRLPSESEWEYAARAGTTTTYWWGNQVGIENAHCFNCKSGLHPRKPAKVGYFKPNPFGLYDTSGNVMEWVHDCYHPNYKGAPTDGSVWEGGDCRRHIARGGSFSSASSGVRNAKREKLVSNSGYDNVGIRLVRELK